MRRVAIGLAIANAITCSPATPRDVVPETHDVHVTADAQPPPTGGFEGYAYVARRARGVVALAGTKNLAHDDARRIVDRLADALDACARGLEQQGTLVSGAARYVVAGLPHGTDITDLQLESGDAVAKNALLCVVAPARAVPLPLAAADGGIPAVLLDATWAPVQTGKTTVSREAGAN